VSTPPDTTAAAPMAALPQGPGGSYASAAATPRPALSTVQQVALVTLRVAIGWHLCYQGWGKLQAVQWTSAPFLGAATGPFAPWFHALADSPRLWLADQAVMWSLVVLGALLMVGLFTRTASLLAMALLLSFYLATPPWPVHGFVAEGLTGWELYVNQVLIEVLALGACLAFDTGRISGLDVLIRGRRQAAGGKQQAASSKRQAVSSEAIR
jgi:thiosulfate dehydrogenase (quinone) large subunit